MVELTSFRLRNAPTLIENIYPAQKVSFEAQRERKAGAGQTLTAIGAYWKGRKPLILVRSIVLGSLLPQTNDSEKDLDIFEMLMGFDPTSLSKRALINNKIKPIDIATAITISNPWDYFSHNVKDNEIHFPDVESLAFPIAENEFNLKLKWRRDLSEENKLYVIGKYLQTLGTYEERAALCKRPEEVDQTWLYSHVWGEVADKYKEYGITATSHQSLIEQLGILRFGRRPKVADTFTGGGSIPFEAARLGADVYASDLNPVALMLTWGALNFIGSTDFDFEHSIESLNRISNSVEDKVLNLGIEKDKEGNRAKAYLYCLETKCPETGWLIPMSTTWVISQSKGVIAELVPNELTKSFDIQVVTGVSKERVAEAKKGTIQGQSLVYTISGNAYKQNLSTLKGRSQDGELIPGNLRKWEKEGFCDLEGDLFKERLYCVYWMDKDSLDSWRPKTFFKSVTDEDLEREKKVLDYVSEHFLDWQRKGIVPDMEIEAGYNTNQPIRERGWSYWHHLFNPRNLLTLALYREESNGSAVAQILFADLLNYYSRLCAMKPGGAGSRPEEIWIGGVFSNQSLNTFYNFGCRAFSFAPDKLPKSPYEINTNKVIANHPAQDINVENDIYITDPPYADAVNYHEITEFFISWLRKCVPLEFANWTWDSRRALAIKGAGDDFRTGMIDAYKAMTEHMSDNGTQCVMFTHQDTQVWSDMIGIFWASGLQVMSAWYIATETTNAQKKGAYVQGTVILMLRKRPAGENSGFKQRLLPAVRAEVKNQIETMMHLNDELKDKMGEPVFNDSDLQMAGYAAALKVLTSYTHIGGEDVTTFALRPRTKGEITVVDEIVQQAAEAANSLLVPEGLSADTWQKLSGIQRFYLRLMDIETTGSGKLDNYQNFAKAFRVGDYTRVMGSMAANKAQLKRIPEFASRDLTENSEIGSTWLGQLIIGLQQLLAEAEPQTVISHLQEELPDFMEIRPLLIDMLKFIENKAPEQTTRDVAEVLGARLRNMRALGN
ncbi:DUF1156 domain-containing protein [Vibrio splendidus]|uniref:anti-phage-associated DUF1156 domain-containing protein n=1 Tax=Vibrio splendidus TaxID=29497 RepID=UPI000C823586|nr:anti-phage-associated DUF1156 domain-containing protein [Vibrio splendidus]MCC5517985.1 DUF1156 domain-containing protein [Vibrio splendidus]